jgi:hypothetical protein
MNEPLDHLHAIQLIRNASADQLHDLHAIFASAGGRPAILKVPRPKSPPTPVKEEAPNTGPAVDPPKP